MMSSWGSSSSSAATEPSAPANTCATCGEPAKSHCAKCKATFYCCREHQVEHWPTHKKTCGKTPSANSSNSNSTANAQSNGAAFQPRSPLEAKLGRAISANAWAQGLSKEKQIEWLVDCYRMRQDDNYAYAGDATGLYNPEAGAAGIVRSFLLFCKCAVRNHALPAGGWDWARFLQYAAGQVIYAFEKSDAQEKYGSENVFEAMMGGRSLRATAELIYGSSATEGCVVSAHNEPVERAVSRVDCFKKKGKQSMQQVADLFEDVGGHALWTKFLKDVRAKYVRPSDNYGGDYFDNDYF